MSDSRVAALLAWAFLGLLIATVHCQSVTVIDISSTGTGCPPGTAGKSISNDRRSFSLIFDQFVASGVDPSPNRTCSVVFQLSAPAQWRSSELTLTFRGYTQLTSGGTGQLQQDSVTVAVARSNKAPVTTVQGPVNLASFNGSIDDAYFVQRAVPGLRSIGRSNQCNAGVVTVTYQLTLSVLNGQMTVDSIDGLVANDTFWRNGARCG